MNKVLFIALGVLGAQSLHAQEPADALRFSWYVPGASARIKAVGGAMGSLGGDITATYVNPAGLAFYRTGDFVLSPNYQFGQTRAGYLGTNTSDKNKRFTWGATGIVLGSGGHPNRNVRNSTFSLSYNRTADFNSDVLYRGRNTQSSYSQKYLEEIQRNNIKDGNVLATQYPYGSSLAFNTYWIDTVGGGTNGNFQFQSRAANLLSSGLLQQQTIHTKGGIDELALGLAVNLKDKLMIGGSLGVPILHYNKSSEFVEADATANNNKFNYAMVNEELQTVGVGFNLRAGLIYKPVEYWRLGLAVHSPTVYSLEDRYETWVTTDAENGQVYTDYSRDYNNSEPTRTKYTYISPYKVIGSVSYVLREIQDVTRQRGFLTADVEYVNYKSNSYSADTEEGQSADPETKAYYRSLNTAIDNAYKGAFNFRVGGELKFTTWMVRLGGAYYGNPYKNIAGEKGSRVNLSGGLGYRDRGFFVDLTYVHAINKDVHFAYRLRNSPYSGASLRNTGGNVFLTLGVKI